MVATLPCAGAHSTSGKPTYQQDRHVIQHTAHSSLYLVADGHGSPTAGHIVAEHCAKLLPSLLTSRGLLSEPHRPEAPSQLRAAIAELDQSAIDVTSALRVYAGSTLCLVLHAASHLLVANVGDSRAVLISSRGSRALSTDHVCTLPKERARIEAAGGWIVGGLLNGHISMSRAIGDDDLKGHRNLTPFEAPDGTKGHRFRESLFVANADVTRATVGANDLVAVVASDGVWGKLSNEAVAAVVREQLSKGRSAQETARAVVRKAIAKGSRDNVTTVVALLHDERHVAQRLGGAPLPARTSRRIRTTLQAVKKPDPEFEAFASREAPDVETSTDSGTDSSPRDVREGQFGSKGQKRERLFSRRGGSREKARSGLWTFGNRGATR